MLSPGADIRDSPSQQSTANNHQTLLKRKDRFEAHTSSVALQGMFVANDRDKLFIFAAAR